MIKIIRILIFVMISLNFVSLQPAAINASKSAARQTSNLHPSHLSFPSNIVAAEDNDWIIECVDCPKQFGEATDRGLRLYSSGNPNIAYGGDHLYHAWHDGAVWHTEIVDDSPRVGNLASMDMDIDGNLHISYFDEYYKVLKYAYQDEYGWHIEAVDRNVGIGTSNSLAVDWRGHPHISYITESDELKYAYLDNSQWYIQTIETGECSHVSLAVDTTAVPHVSYRVLSEHSIGQLNYATLDSNNWNIQTIDIDGDTGYHTSLALDTNGIPHIVYLSVFPLKILKNGADYLMKYASLTNTGWSIQNVTTAGGEGYSLALDGQDKAHISFYHRGLLYYAFQDADGWQAQTVYDYGLFVNRRSSIDVDQEGVPHIIYYAGGHLRYAYQGEAGWENLTIDSADEKVGMTWSVGSQNTLAINQEGFPHISYRDVVGTLKYAKRDKIGWSIQIIGQELGGGNGISLALDESGYPHIAFMDSGLFYAYQNETGWNSELVDIDAHMFPTLKLDNNRFPHISYEAASATRYAYKDHDGWQNQIVIDGISPGMTLNEANYPNISYGAPGTRALHYGYADETGWHFESTGSPGVMYSGSSIIIDQIGFPHILYSTDHVIQYVKKDSYGWDIQIIGSGSRYPSLVLDEMGFPHISYQDGADLIYIYRNASGWHKHIVDDKGTDDVYSSIALDASGNPHISYQSGNDLKYAYLTGSPGESLLQPSVSKGYAAPDSTITYTIQVFNSSLIPDTYDITINNNSWPTASPEKIGPVEAGYNSSLDILVTIPPTATLGSSDTATITLTSQSDPNVTATAMLTTYAAITTYLPLVER